MQTLNCGQKHTQYSQSDIGDQSHMNCAPVCTQKCQKAKSLYSSGSSLQYSSFHSQGVGCHMTGNGVHGRSQGRTDQSSQTKTHYIIFSCCFLWNFVRPPVFSRVSYWGQCGTVHQCDSTCGITALLYKYKLVSLIYLQIGI